MSNIGRLGAERGQREQQYQDYFDRLREANRQAEQTYGFDLGIGDYPTNDELSPNFQGFQYDTAADANQMVLDQLRESGQTISPDGTILGTEPSPGMWGNLFSGDKGAGRAMAMGGDMGASLGALAGGLMSIFGDQPSAMLDAYKRLQAAYQNIDDPNTQRDLWNAPIFRQIAQYTPEMVRDLTESVDDMETYEEGDASLRAQEDVALARISERARRGDPLAQRIQTQQAQAGVGRALGRAGETAQEQAARRGMPGQGAPGQAQAGADYASRVGQQNVLAARGDQARAEMAALSGASSIRASRESATERAMNIRNNFRNAMSNRQLSIALTNQQARQQSSDRNQTMAQRLHESNLDRQDKRRMANRDQYNRWETDDYNREVERTTREGRLDIEIGKAEDEAAASQMAGITGALTGAGKIAGTMAGAGFFPG